MREPSALFWSFGFPILLSIALGLAFRDKPSDPVRVVIEAGEGAEPIRALFATSPDVEVSVLDPVEAAAALRVGRASIVVRAGSPIVYVYDPSRPESRFARAKVDDLLQRAGGRKDVTAVADQKVTEPGSRYIDFLIPGLIGLNLMSSGMWGIGYAIVESRTKKLLKRMVATPMKRGQFLLSFVIMRMLFVALELSVLLGFAHFAFDVVVRGPLALLVVLAALGGLAFSGIGLLVASRARNTQTVGGLINVVQLPMFVLSGVFFSSSQFPDFLQPFIRLLPLTALNDSMRAVMNEGAGWMAVAPQAGLILLTSVLSFGLALRIFRWG
jgi:ABC-2 type transport system permease protein